MREKSSSNGTRIGGLAVAMGVVLLLGYVVLAAPGADGEVGGSEARRLVADGALLLDVRTPGEFASAHIEGALNVPVDELEGRLGEIGAPDRAVVVYCRSGNRSARAADILRAAGWTTVHDLGAMSSW